MKDKNDNSKGSTKRKEVKSLSYKREALKELEEGKLTVKEFLVKYKIASATLRDWRRQVKRGRIGRNTYPSQLKLKIVREVTSGVLTAEEAVEKYDISVKALIIDWIKEFSCQVPLTSMAKKKDLTSEQEKIKKLEEALKYAQLKILGLETLINVAEKELKVDIRKKPGTKQ